MYFNNSASMHVSENICIIYAGSRVTGKEKTEFQWPHRTFSIYIVLVDVINSLLLTSTVYTKKHICYEDFHI